MNSTKLRLLMNDRCHIKCLVEWPCTEGGGRRPLVALTAGDRRVMQAWENRQAASRHRPLLNCLHNSLERRLIGVTEGPCQGAAPESHVTQGSAGSAGRNGRPVSSKCTVG